MAGLVHPKSAPSQAVEAKGAVVDRLILQALFRVSNLFLSKTTLDIFEQEIIVLPGKHFSMPVHC